MLKVDILELNTRSRTVVRSGRRPVRLTAKEYALLECLMCDAKHLLTRQHLGNLRNEPYEPFSNLIEEYIKRLREKLISRESDH